MGKINGIKANWSTYFSTIIKCGETKRKTKSKNFKLSEHSWKNNYCGENLYSTKLPIIVEKTCTNTNFPIIVVKPSTTLNFKWHARRISLQIISVPPFFFFVLFINVVGCLQNCALT
jgi:hypothetical protein